MSKKTSKNTLTKLEQFSLRMQLLKFWFIKNITVFLWLLFIVCVGLTFSGLIDKDTPVLGVIFGSLSEEISAIFNNNEAWTNFYGITESVVCLIIAIALCAKKLKALSFDDIKTTKCKLLLVKAGLWFNEDGKLTKRIETVTKTDINKDGLIGEKKAEEIQSQENIVEGLKRAGEEFVTIVTLDLSNIEKDEKEEVYKTTGLTETKAGVDELNVIIKNDTKKLFGQAEEEVNTKEKSDLFSGVKSFFNDMKTALTMTSKTEEEKRMEEKEKQAKKEAKLKAEKQKELAKKKAKEEEKKEVTKNIKQIKTEKIEIKRNKEEKAKEKEVTIKKAPVKPGNAQSQLSDILKKK